VDSPRGQAGRACFFRARRRQDRWHALHRCCDRLRRGVAVAGEASAARPHCAWRSSPRPIPRRALGGLGAAKFYPRQPGDRSRPSPAPAAKDLGGPPSRGRSGSDSVMNPPASAPSGWWSAETHHLRLADDAGSDRAAPGSSTRIGAATGVTHLALEALVRTGSISTGSTAWRIAAGGFTNLSARSHGLSPGCRANYLAAKLRLFREPGGGGWCRGDLGRTMIARQK